MALQIPKQTRTRSLHTIALIRKPLTCPMHHGWYKALSFDLRMSYLIDSAPSSAFPSLTPCSQNALTPSTERTTISFSLRPLAVAKRSHLNLLSVGSSMVSWAAISKLSTKLQRNLSAPNDSVTGRRSSAHLALNVQSLLVIQTCRK